PPAALGPPREPRKPGASPGREQPAKRRAFEVVVEERDGHPFDDREPASVIRVRRQVPGAQECEHVLRSGSGEEECAVDTGWVDRVGAALGGEQRRARVAWDDRLGG